MQKFSAFFQQNIYINSLHHYCVMASHDLLAELGISSNEVDAKVSSMIKRKQS